MNLEELVSLWRDLIWTKEYLQGTTTLGKLLTKDRVLLMLEDDIEKLKEEIVKENDYV